MVHNLYAFNHDGEVVLRPQSWTERVEAVVDHMTRDRSAAAASGSLRGDGRGVIESAFRLLGYVGALEPVPLLDLVNVSRIPPETVRRLLQQLIAVGAVTYEHYRYRLGASLLGLGSREVQSIDCGWPSGQSLRSISPVNAFSASPRSHTH